MRKLSTGIKGLDALFYGGIQLDEQENERIIIAIRGVQGCYKTILAMQLMSGLTASLRERFKENPYHSENSRTPKFFSLNKSSCELNDMYLDIVINREIYKYIESYDSSKPDTVSRLFKLDTEAMEGLQSVIGGKFDFGQLIRRRLVYYNSRTNAIHLNVDDSNHGPTEFFKRKSDDISDYNIQELINVEFLDYRAGYGKNQDINFEGRTPIARFQEAYLGIVNSPDLLPCIVIDGLSLLNVKEQKSLPYSELERILRRKAKISILVLDDKTELQINADIVIELRTKESQEEEYLYNELHVAKSVFQNAALGWHQYKKRDDGIAVFPSLHMLLSRRNYLPHGLLMWRKSVLEDTFEDYENNKLYCSHNDASYQDYISNERSRKMNLLFDIYNTHTQKSGNEKSEQCSALQNILSGTINNNAVDSLGWENHYPSTAIIGNPNSYKRTFAIAGAFYAARRGEHTIFVLFDKNEADMRRRICCPGMPMLDEVDQNTDNAEVLKDCSRQCDTCHRSCKLKKCYNCYEHLHFFQVRMGCISAEEFFDALLRLIKHFADIKANKPCHIVIDDLQKLDYSFPFLKSNPLFMSTLISLCRENYAELKMICDKKASVVDELCSLSDNVLCIKREEKDDDCMTVYLERNLGGVESTGLCRYEIEKPYSLFKCDGSGLAMNEQCVTPVNIGSMKEFWRQTYNSITTKPRTVVFENRKNMSKK